ncbi:MAG: hypothetical protein ABSD38_26430 [Syntrophorhabdales bacterium]
MERILEGFCHHLAVKGFRLGRRLGVEAGFEGAAKAGVGGDRCRPVPQTTATDHKPLVKPFGKVVDVEGCPIARACVLDSVSASCSR